LNRAELARRRLDAIVSSFSTPVHFHTSSGRQKNNKAVSELETAFVLRLAV